MFTEKVNLQSSANLLIEGLLDYDESRRPDHVLLLFAPHPKLGGDMENNVLRGLARDLPPEGICTLRFNYRGVGNSERPDPDVAAYDYWERLDESNDYHDILADGIDILRYAEKFAPGARVSMLGYSFGAKIIEGVCRTVQPQAVIAIAAPLNRDDFRGLAELPCRKLFLWGNEDFATTPEQVRAFTDIALAPKDIVVIPGQDHFFREYEPQLALQVRDFMRRHD
ncbi:MAG: hypothetical protein A3K18_06480 [Lentisphaerae bacterium RIFOXYA12_64_32]|nr:MAG: hypothetical protein A3K18_06480 [Lentisphaerae bacterium RIFOXYA12_64_32]